MIPVTVVTGFLGAGKTTLVDDWLGRLPAERIAVIVNEVAAVGVDGALLSARAAALREIVGGCACCTTRQELARAVHELAGGSWARIIVETSGAASPASVVRTVLADERLALEGVVTVVDPEGPLTGALEGISADLAAEQVGYADLLVVSRADVAVGTLDLEQRLRAMNPTAHVVRSTRGALPHPLEALLARRTELPEDLPRLAHAGAIESVALTLEGAVDEERFGDFMEQEVAPLAGRLLRSKGVLAIAGVAQPMILQGVADRVEVTFGESVASSSSRLVLVGFGLDVARLRAAFAACQA